MFNTISLSDQESAWEFEFEPSGYPTITFTSVPAGATWQDAIDANLILGSLDVDEFDIHCDSVTLANGDDCPNLVSYDFNDGYYGYFILNDEVEDEVIYITVNEEILLNVAYSMSAE